MVQLGNSSQHMWMVVQDVVHRCISKSLDRFIPRKHHARFFELLESTEAAVVSGFIRHIMCLEEDIYRFVFLTQLSLLIPIGRFGDSDTGRRWVHFISNCGDYGATCDNDTSLPYSRTSSSTYFFNQMSSVRGHFSSPEVGAKNPVSSMFRYHLWSARTTTLYQPSYPHQKRHCLMSWRQDESIPSTQHSFLSELILRRAPSKWLRDGEPPFVPFISALQHTIQFRRPTFTTHAGRAVILWQVMSLKWKASVSSGGEGSQGNMIKMNHTESDPHLILSNPWTLNGELAPAVTTRHVSSSISVLWDEYVNISVRTWHVLCILSITISKRSLHPFVLNHVPHSRWRIRLL